MICQTSPSGGGAWVSPRITATVRQEPLVDPRTGGTHVSHTNPVRSFWRMRTKSCNEIGRRAARTIAPRVGVPGQSRLRHDRTPDLRIVAQ